MWWWVMVACTGGTTSDSTGSTSDTATPSTEVPVDDLDAWLATGEYLDWPAEEAPHASAGPHFGTVRTFLSPALAASLEAGATQHPEGPPA